ncbi:MAG: ribonuclease D [Alphaproteobacteria bacterium]|nr:ribonuclease D [Alphaproteobacteria bacterium]
MTLIDDSAALAAFCKALARVDYVALDTEFMRESTFWPQLCLVQLAGPEKAVAIDSLAPGIDLQPLFDLMANRRVLKVMHGGRQDMEIFHHLSGELPNPVVDTQVAAMVAGFGDQVGYETLIARLTGQGVDKASRFTDWSLRPLSKHQLDYALGDVIHLREAYEKLRDRIEAAGRTDWVAEEMAVFENPATYRLDPPNAWRRLKPRTNDRRQLAVLQAIAAWREDEAATRDLPRNRIVRDEALLEIAAHPPKSAADLGRIRGVSRGFAEGRLAATLLTAVERGLSLPLDEAPEPPPRPVVARGVGPLTDLFKVLLNLRCEEWDVAKKLVASSDDLQAIAGDDEAEVPALAGWRREMFGADALALKHGRLALAANGKQVVLVTVEGGIASVPAPSAARPEGGNGAGEGDGRARRKRRRRRRRGANGNEGPATGVADESSAESVPEEMV